MRFLSAVLNKTWKRFIAAVVLSGLIILAVQTFAESSYVQTQKIQQEGVRGQHCKKWSYQKQGNDTAVTCVSWPAK